jgi:hypothetical protein
MNWTVPADLRRQIQRMWDSGLLLAAPLRGEQLFPFRMTLRGPAARALSDEFEAVRSWIREWETGAGYQLEWAEINHRLLGRNRIPAAVSVVSEEDAFLYIGKSEEAARFRTIASETASRSPALSQWLARKPLVALEQGPQWTRILDVVNWFREHPRCGLYLRQIDIPGVDTKFIEERKPLLTELLDLALPLEAIDAGAPGWRSFERRYALRPKPNSIRFRVLDPGLAIQGLTDLSVPAQEFARLELRPDQVFVTENEINGLAFPDVPGGLVIFGLGYGLDRLSEIPWLSQIPIHYWGDIDTHGFAMLDRLRAIFPAAQSFLMDRETLCAHANLWVRESAPYLGELSRLSPVEQALYDDLRFHRLGDQVRLEQERIAFRSVQQALAVAQGRVAQASRPAREPRAPP